MNVKLSAATIRDFVEADAESLARHLDDEEIWRNLRDRVPHPYTVQDAEEFIAGAMSASPPSRFAIEVDGEAAGGCAIEVGVDVNFRAAEIGFWLGRAFWGRGIMSEVVPELVEHTFASFDVVRVEAKVFAWNPASMRVLEKSGFEHEATLRNAITKQGHTMDLEIFAILRPPRKVDN